MTTVPGLTEEQAAQVDWSSFLTRVRGLQEPLRGVHDQLKASSVVVDDELEASILDVLDVLERIEGMLERTTKGEPDATTT